MTTRPPGGTSENAAAIAAIPDESTSAGCALPSRAPSASSNGCHVSVSIRAYMSSPGAGTPVETYVDESTTGGFTGPPCTRGGRPAVTASVEGDGGRAGARSSGAPAGSPGAVVTPAG